MDQRFQKKKNTNFEFAKELDTEPLTEADKLTDGSMSSLAHRLLHMRATTLWMVTVEPQGFKYIRK